MRVERKQCVVVVSVLTVIGLVGTALMFTSGNREFAARYKRLQLGNHISDVIDTIGAEPDYEYRYASFRIWYFKSPSFFCRDPDSSGYGPGKVVSELKDLPDWYGFVQMAFDSNDTLVAHTWIGEAYAVTSASGSVKGSHFRVLGTLED